MADWRAPRTSSASTTTRRAPATVWEGGCNRMGGRLQPYGGEAAAVWEGGCNRMGGRLQPYGREAATVWGGGCSRMGGRLQPCSSVCSSSGSGSGSGRVAGARRVVVAARAPRCSLPPIRLQPPSHTVAASLPYSCSLPPTRLQPPSHTVAASLPYGCSLPRIRLQVLCQEFLAGDEYVVDSVSRGGVHKVSSTYPSPTVP